MRNQSKNIIKRAILSLFFTCAFFFISIIGYGQSENNKKTIKQAEYLFKKGDYDQALPIYLKFESQFEEGIILREVLDFRIAFCYYNSLLEREKSISWFKKYLSQTDSIFDAHYFLASSYHLNHQFDEAIEEYEVFIDFVKKDIHNPKEVIEIVLSSVNSEIERCNYGKVLINNPINVIVENLGEEINTANSEYAPVIFPDESKIAFTRRSPETVGEKLSPDGDFYEDIYISTIIDGSLFSPPNYDSLNGAGFNIMLADFKFSTPKSISPMINSKTHEGAVQFSYDGSKLYIYRNFNVWVSDYENEEWTTPKSLEALANVFSANAYEPSVSISINGDAIYFASDRPGGYGGLDIYKSTKTANGSWNAPVNLGSQINTSFDEDSPYIDPDGITFYFSSKGHSSMGGYDIFKSIYKNGNWSQSQNLGYPVNTAGNDIFFMMTPRYNRGYYSSNKPGGYGKMDIYRLTFAKERPPLAEIRGLILKGDTLLPSYSHITIYNPETGDEISNHYSDSISGEYLLLFAHGQGYKIKVETDGFAPYQRGFNIPEQLDYYQYYQEIHHVYLKDSKGNVIGQKITMFNATFDNDSIGKETMIFAKNSQGSAAKLLQELKQNNLLKFEELSDVKFYISRDSIISLQKRYPELKFDFSKGTSISFLDTTISNDKNNLDAYVAVDLQSFVLSQNTTEKEIAEVIMPKVERAEVPSILLYFDYGKEKLRPEAKQKLSSLIDFLSHNPELTFEVIGHTDSKGDQEYNLELSIKRAETVKKYIVRNGIDSNRLKVIGKGESSPVVPNTFEDKSDNPEGRLLNRRVEFKLLGKGGSF